jgi:XTP/dITP diphosphohydrolase
MKKLLIATTNPGKLEEIKFFLKDLAVKLVGLTDLKIKEKAKEDGKTFEENAKKKAVFYYKISGFPTIADDGGLEIDYLKGEPGVKSRRWINGTDAGDEELIEYALKKLKGVPIKKRGAQLRAVIALALPNGQIYTSKGVVRGVIAEKRAPFMTPGYPFRSLLYLPEIGKYYNHEDLTFEENEKYNHRGLALKKLKRIIRKKLINEDNKVILRRSTILL